MSEPSIPDITDPVTKEVLLKQLETQSPELAMLYKGIEKYVQEQEADVEDSLEIAYDDEIAQSYDSLVEQYNALVDEVERSEQERFKRRSEIAKLKKIIKLQKSQIEFYAQLIKELSLALGMCPQCAGRKSDCRLCYGLGSPGYMRPDLKMLQKWVRPSVEAQRKS